MPIQQLDAQSKQNQNQQANSQANSPPISPNFQAYEAFKQVIDPTIQEVYTASLRAPIRLEVLNKFGVGRSGLSRSKELNAFRDGLKHLARSQARRDVTEEINKDNNGQLTKVYYSLLANYAVHSEAKGSVDAIMEQETERILDDVLPSRAITPHLKQAAYGAMQSNQSGAKLLELVVEKAQKKADELFEPLKEDAIDEARYIVKGKKDDENPSRRSKSLTTIAQDVQKHVTSNEVGKNAVSAAITADSFDSALAKVAPLIKQVVPFDGDSAELSVEIKIPVAPNGFISIHLGTEAEHDGEHYQLGVEANIGGGGTFKIAELKGSIGLFIEAKGPSENAALSLMSYGLYRQMYTTFPSIAKAMWGMGKKTGYSKLEEAEVWAAMIEEKYLQDEDSYVSIGQQAAFDASIETGIYEGDFQIKGQRTTTYNRENLDKLNSDEHTNAQLAKLNRDSVPSRLLQFLGVKSADPNKKVLQKSDIPQMTFGDNIDISYMIAQEDKNLSPHLSGGALDHSKKVGRENLLKRSKRYAEIGAKKSLSVSTEHTLSLPKGSIELGADFSLSADEISGEISFGFPEELKKLKGDDLFNHLFPKLTNIANSAAHLLYFNGDESIKNVNQFEGIKGVTTNAIQSVITSRELEGALEDLHGTTLRASIGLTYNLTKKELELELNLSKDTSHEISKKNKLDLEILNLSYSKSSKIAGFSKTFSF